MALLAVEDLTAGYGSGPDILTGLSLRIERDRSYCIIGPNGAGKSTLLRVIAGLLPARRGRVIFKDEPLSGLRADQVLKRGIGFVPQDKSLFPDMTVRENLRMGGYILRDRAEVERRIETVQGMFPILRERSGAAGQDAFRRRAADAAAGPRARPEARGDHAGRALARPRTHESRARSSRPWSG